MKRSDCLRERAKDIDVAIPGLFVVDPSTKEKKPVTAKVRALTAPEESQARTFAREYAKKQGATKLDIGDPDWELGFRAQAIAFSFLDSDSPETARAPFYASAEEVLRDEHESVIAWLFERQDSHQDATSPYLHKLSGPAFLEMIEKEVAGDADRFFYDSSPALRLSCWRIMVTVVSNCREAKSMLSRLLQGEPTSSVEAPPMDPTPPTEH